MAYGYQMFGVMTAWAFAYGCAFGVLYTAMRVRPTASKSKGEAPRSTSR